MARLRLLIITQSVDRNNPVLGFFHRWIEEFAKYCERVTVICLEKGEYRLPDSVIVLSLGKEEGQSRLKYLWRFYKYIWQERKNYDKVFVHMNQEYVLLAGWWWRLTSKKVTMWRNHHAGNWLTDLAAAFCHKVFCTSRYSYTARYRKTILMPVGIDAGLFRLVPGVIRRPNSVLFLARMAPAKRPHLLIEALEILAKRGIKFTADFYGDPLLIDQEYYWSLQQIIKDKNLTTMVFFYPSLPNYLTPETYSTHQVFVNLSSSGMYDKTIFEAALCGAVPLTSNRNLRGEVDSRLMLGENLILDLADRLELLFKLPPEELAKLQQGVEEYVLARHTLGALAAKLFRGL